jgi:hypothetical protein
MKTSELINELATALSKAQSVMTGAKKGSDNPFFKSKYSDLSEVMEAISEPFADNGLCFVQGAEFEDGRVAVTTRIMHTSGQWIEAVTALPPTKNDAQGYGSAISYAKRYGLQALAGVPSVDDDGQDAVKHKADKPASVARITRLQADLIIDLLESTSTDKDKFLGFFAKKSGIDIHAVSELPVDAFTAAKKMLEDKLQVAA